MWSFKHKDKLDFYLLYLCISTLILELEMTFSRDSQLLIVENDYRSNSTTKKISVELEVLNMQLLSQPTVHLIVHCHQEFTLYDCLLLSSIWASDSHVLNYTLQKIFPKSTTTGHRILIIHWTLQKHPHKFPPVLCYLCSNLTKSERCKLLFSKIVAQPCS